MELSKLTSPHNSPAGVANSTTTPSTSPFPAGDELFTFSDLLSQASESIELGRFHLKAGEVFKLRWSQPLVDQRKNHANGQYPHEFVELVAQPYTTVFAPVSYGEEYTVAAETSELDRDSVFGLFEARSNLTTQPLKRSNGIMDSVQIKPATYVPVKHGEASPEYYRLSLHAGTSNWPRDGAHELSTFHGGSSQ